MVEKKVVENSLISPTFGMALGETAKLFCPHKQQVHKKVKKPKTISSEKTEDEMVKTTSGKKDKSSEDKQDAEDLF